MTLPVVSVATQRVADAQDTSVRSEMIENGEVHVSPAFVETKTSPVPPTATHVVLPEQASAVKLVEPSMFCFEAVAVPLLSIVSFSALPAPSTATHDVVDIQASPVSLVDPSTSVSFQAEDLIWVALVPIRTCPELSVSTQNDDDTQETPVMPPVPCCSEVQDVEAGLV